jgi:hypothetical protein
MGAILVEKGGRRLGGRRQPTAGQKSDGRGGEWFLLHVEDIILDGIVQELGLLLGGSGQIAEGAQHVDQVGPLHHGHPLRDFLHQIEHNAGEWLKINWRKHRSEELIEMMTNLH